ncbi:MAG TPA: hypothetical protein VFV37_11135, partial [Luteibaculaceae bacterium]|nr:hypothetical protein [Luteibaculaceae bacterium]
MRNIFTLFALIALLPKLAAVDYTAVSSGNWSSSSTWSPSGVPTAADNVTINGLYTVTVSQTASCNQLTLTGALGVLTVSPGVTLTVTGNFLQYVDDVVDISTVNVLGSLSIGGNLTLSYTYLAAVTSSNQFNIGDASNAGSVSVGGNVSMYSSTSIALTLRNKISLRNGTLTVGGAISFTSAGSGASIQQLEVDDDGSYNNKSKTIRLSGALTVQSTNSIKINDSNASSDFTFDYAGTTQQTLVTSNMVYQNLRISNAAGVILSSNFPSASLLKTLTIATGGLLNTKTFHLDNITSFAGQIVLQSGATLRVENTSGVPAQKVSGLAVATCAADAIIEFYTTGTMEVLNEAFEYPIVKLTGSGTKELLDYGIDNNFVKVNQVRLSQGTWYFDGDLPLILTSNLNKTVYLDSGTTWEIFDDFTSLDAFFSIHYNNICRYNNNSGPARIYSLLASSGQVEPYGQLEMERKNGLGILNRVIWAGDVVKVRGRVTLATKCQLTIEQNAILELCTDANYTGFIAELPSDANIWYTGSPSGKVVARKQIYLPTAAYRDFTSPIKSKTLQTLKNSGVTFTGFTGSQYPSSSFKSAYKYDETNLGTLNQGFTPATNITDSLVTTNTSGYITSAGWRIYSGRSSGLSLTLSDTGEVNVGTRLYRASFSHGSNSRSYDDGWNFFGNPYPSAISWDEIYADPVNTASFAADGIQPTVYMWMPYQTGVPNDVTSYGFYNAATGVGYIATGIIPSFQGFWVKVHHATSNSTAYTLQIKESHKTDQYITAFHKSGVDYNALKVELKLTSSAGSDRIWFHPYPKATVGFDPVYDVPRLSEEAPESINFNQGGENLNCWVNAVPMNQNSWVLPIQMYSASGGNYTFSVSHLAGFLDQYGCLELQDPQTGQRTPLTQDTVISVVLPAGYNGIRFVIKAYRNLSGLIQTADASCFDKNDGALAVDLSQFDEHPQFTLSRNGQIIASFDSTTAQVNMALGAGNYVLQNLMPNTGCVPSSYPFTILSHPEVIANFSAPEQWPVNAFVPIENQSSGGGTYEWYFPEINTYSELKNPLVYFENSGLKHMQLTVSNEWGCRSTPVERSVSVVDPSGISDSAHARGVKIQSADEFFAINNEGAMPLQSCAVYSSDGKLLYSSREIGNRFVVPLAKTNQLVLVVV